MNAGRRLRTRRDAAERTETYYRKVADQLIEQIEQGTARWTQARQVCGQSNPIAGRTLTIRHWR